MSCCAAKEWEKPEVPNGVCPNCGQDTVDGEAFEGCYYSPNDCELCDSRPCDGSC
jgi:hypothetical protein